MNAPGHLPGLPRRLALAAAVFLALGGGSAGAADPGGEATAAAGEPAEIRVTGLGWLQNISARRTLKLLQPEDQPLETLDAAFIEDAVVLLQSALEDDGFLNATGVVRLPEREAEDETRARYPWKAGAVPALPRDLQVHQVIFQIDPGVRYTFAHLEFSGLEALDEAAARSYFVQEGLLFGGGGARRYNPGILRRGLNNLQEELRRMGYADAKVELASEQRDHATGDVRVSIRVDQGPRHFVGQVALAGEVPEVAADEVENLRSGAGDAVYSPLWQQDFAQAVRAALYAHGYANAEVQLAPTGQAPGDGRVRRDFRLTIRPGRQIHVGQVDFAGDPRTAGSVLERATTVEPGDLFSRRRVEQDRLRLGTLGIFSSVRAETTEAAPGIWDLTYRLTPGRRLEASVLAGYGSYEQLRGGFELFHANLFGHAHRGRAQFIVSQKSYSGDYLYTVPQIFGTATDASARVFGLNRKEVSFDRREYGASLGARRRIEWLGAEASLRYQYEFVGADHVSPDVADTVPTDSNVASLTFDLTRDRLDNPVTPHAGYLLALSLETATKALGSQVDYQRLDLRAAWHRRVGREKYVHAGLRHGVVWALGGTSEDDIPLAKRYFPGGEGSVRGFREGRAAPRGPDGSVIGAEISTVLNLEFEQGVTDGLSAVVFVDAGLTAARLADYPGNETRVSLGLGLRYNTPIGPARLEYGHNIVREDGDAVGEVHFALGFPF